MTSSKTASAMGKLFRPWAAAKETLAMDNKNIEEFTAPDSTTPLTTSSASAFTSVTTEASSLHQRTVKKTERYAKRKSLDCKRRTDRSKSQSKSVDIFGVPLEHVNPTYSNSSQSYLGFGDEIVAASSMFDPTAMAASLGCLGNAMSGVYPSAAGMCCPGVQCPDLEAALEEYGRLLLQETQQQNSRNRKQRPKKFRCPHCQVGFSNNGQLKGHIRIHTGERPFRCDAEHCGKSFTRNEELTRHKRIHSGLRPFPCSVCGKRFGRKDHLKKHARTHQVRLHPPALIPVLPPAQFSPYLYAAAGF